MKTNWSILLFAALLILSACDAQPTTDGAPAADGPSSDEAAPPAQDGPEGNAAGRGDDDATAQFLKYLGDKVRLEWRIAYDTTMTIDGETTTTQMTLYLKGTDKMRTDATVPEFGESRTYVVDGVYTTCFQRSGAWTCMKITPSDTDTTEAQRDFEQEVQEDAADYAISLDGTKQVAGVTATCFKVTSSVDGFGLMRYCFSKEGAPLYTLIEGDAADSAFRTEMIATSYSKNVADSEFIPPAEATEFGAGGTMPAGDASGDNPCAACDSLTGDAKEMCLSYC